MLSERKRQGVYAAIGASLMMAAMGTAIKVVADDAGNDMVVFLRNAFGLLFLLPGSIRRGPGILRTAHPGGHIARSVAGLAAMYCFFYAIAHLHLAEAVLLNFSSPIFTAIFAAIWLKEAVSAWMPNSCVAPMPLSPPKPRKSANAKNAMNSRPIPISE